MTTSDSEAFESADEDVISNSPKKSTLKSQLLENVQQKSDSSSQGKNYGESKIETQKNVKVKKERPKKEQERKPKQAVKLGVKVKAEKSIVEEESTKPLKNENPVAQLNEDKVDEGWDDYDADESPSIEENDSKNVAVEEKEAKKDVSPEKTKDEGWEDDFDDWGETEERTEESAGNTEVTTTNQDATKIASPSEHSASDFKALADRLNALGGSADDKSAGTGGGGWGSWGSWGTSLLTSGVSQITQHVTQGFNTVSNVIESGIGVPNPEELIRMQNEAQKKSPADSEKDPTDTANAQESVMDDKEAVKESAATEGSHEERSGVEKLGKFVSSMTKLVETTGAAVVTGGLDTLEEIGKRTMAVLQGEEEGQKRLSVLLREARDRHSEVDSLTQQQGANRQLPRFEILFDDYQGLVHLEALEMLSKQCDMKIQSLLSSLEDNELTELQETLDQVKDICELPESTEEELAEEEVQEARTNPEVFSSKLEVAIRDMGIPIKFEQLTELWSETLAKVSPSCDPEFQSEQEDLPTVLSAMVYDVAVEAVTSLAHMSALAVTALHRCTALLAIKQRRSTADEADGLTQLTAVLTHQINEVAEVYTAKLNRISVLAADKETVSSHVTNVFLESSKGASYVLDAFHLTIPVIQVGAT